MEIADIKRQVVETIDRARREAGDRRSRAADAAREYGVFLDQRAIPIFKQVANVLRAEGFAFSVFTPAGSVRLMSDRAAEDYVELTLDTGGDRPVVSGHVSRIRGRRIVESEASLGSPAELGEEEVLSFVLKGLEPLVER
ncbi:MAG TPA: hypothetical protein VM818_06785 [Vicinamibacterales bacterium]|jgi:hypothetical protein|nr:hypothetical protein [Vicinamibacterales bacterium]